MPINLDLRLLMELNSLVPSNPLAAKIVVALESNPLIRGLPVFASFVVLWFLSDCRARRGRMLAGMLATAMATGLSVWMQFSLSTHIRPALDSRVHLRIMELAGLESLHRLGSFPSDTATMFFALSAVILLENKAMGIVCFLWSLIVAGLLRVVLGWHYPSDILGALVLGPGCVYLASRAGPLAERLLSRCGERMNCVHAFVFLFLAEAYALFPGLQGILSGIKMTSAYLMR